MRQAVIVATARTPIGRAYRGAFNNIKSPTLMGHAIAHAVSRSGVDPVEIQDVVTGSVLDAGTAGMNIARNAALAAGLPYSVAAQTMDRQCASGLMAVATAAKQVIVDGMDVVVAGGQENISALQTPYMDWVAREQDDNVLARAPHAYMPMLQTAEHVSRKYASRASRRHKLGMRGSDTWPVFFEDCEVPRENVLGGVENVGQGVKVLMSTNTRRLGCGVMPSCTRSAPARARSDAC